MIQSDFPWELPLNHPDGTVRVFGSRGCRYRCLFCQTGWEATYRVNPNPAHLQSQIRQMERQGRRLAIVTNDGAEEGVHVSGQQEFLSVRLQNLKRLMPLSRKQVKSVRIGVEGISERLRLAVGKPVPNDDLLRVSFDLLAAGVGVRWFFIPGLPGEADGDYECATHAESCRTARRGDDEPRVHPTTGDAAISVPARGRLLGAVR